MWKQAKESGLSLAELLVVLAITVVLAAIMMPAVTSPDHGDGTADANLDPYVVAADGFVGVDSDARLERLDAERKEVPTVEDSTELEVEAAVASPFEPAELSTLELDGLRAIKTTDISYKSP